MNKAPTMQQSAQLLEAVSTTHALIHSSSQPSGRGVLRSAGLSSRWPQVGPESLGARVVEGGGLQLSSPVPQCGSHAWKTRIDRGVGDHAQPQRILGGVYHREVLSEGRREAATPP